MIAVFLALIAILVIANLVDYVRERRRLRRRLLVIRSLYGARRVR